MYHCKSIAVGGMVTDGFVVRRLKTEESGVRRSSPSSVILRSIGLQIVDDDAVDDGAVD